jgi:hypothetical protein
MMPTRSIAAFLAAFFVAAFLAIVLFYAQQLPPLTVELAVNSRA